MRFHPTGIKHLIVHPFSDSDRQGNWSVGKGDNLAWQPWWPGSANLVVAWRAMSSGARPATSDEDGTIPYHEGWTRTIWSWYWIERLVRECMAVRMLFARAVKHAKSQNRTVETICAGAKRQPTSFFKQNHFASANPDYSKNCERAEK